MSVQIINQKLVTSPMDLLGLNIIDFNRLNGYWNNTGDALTSIFSWLENFAVVTIYQINDFDQAPKRDDWPEWLHVGHHSHVGKKFWNWFLWYHPEAKLYFSDEPDFWGEYPDGGLLCGDLGLVSASSFLLAQASLGKGDVWISVLNGGHKHVMIEILADRYPRSYRGKRPAEPEQIWIDTARMIELPMGQVCQLGLGV